MNYSENYFFGLKYLTWKTKFLEDMNYFDFSDELCQVFTKHKSKVYESEGDAFSINDRNLIEMRTFSDAFVSLVNEARCNFEYFDAQNKSFNVSKFWANEMHINSSGRLHVHQSPYESNKETLVLIYYHRVPLNASNLIFVHPKYSKDICESKFLFESEIPEVDKQTINVSEGMCILHDGKIPHGVSKHYSNKVRQCLIADFVSTNFVFL